MICTNFVIYIQIVLMVGDVQLAKKNSNRNDDIIGGKHSYITIVRYYICKII